MLDFYELSKYAVMCVYMFYQKIRSVYNTQTNTGVKLYDSYCKSKQKKKNYRVKTKKNCILKDSNLNPNISQFTLTSYSVNGLSTKQS